MTPRSWTAYREKVLPLVEILLRADCMYLAVGQASLVRSLAEAIRAADPLGGEALVSHDHRVDEECAASCNPTPEFFAAVDALLEHLRMVLASEAKRLFSGGDLERLLIPAVKAADPRTKKPSITVKLRASTTGDFPPEPETLVEFCVCGEKLTLDDHNENIVLIECKASRKHKGWCLTLWAPTKRAAIAGMNALQRALREEAARVEVSDESATAEDWAAVERGIGTLKHVNEGAARRVMAAIRKSLKPRRVPC